MNRKYIEHPFEYDEDARWGDSGKWVMDQFGRGDVKIRYKDLPDGTGWCQWVGPEDGFLDLWDCEGAVLEVFLFPDLPWKLEFVGEVMVRVPSRGKRTKRDKGRRYRKIKE